MSLPVTESDVSASYIQETDKVFVSAIVDGDKASGEYNVIQLRGVQIDVLYAFLDSLINKRGRRPAAGQQSATL